MLAANPWLAATRNEEVKTDVLRPTDGAGQVQFTVTT